MDADAGQGAGRPAAAPVARADRPRSREDRVAAFRARRAAAVHSYQRRRRRKRVARPRRFVVVGACAVGQRERRADPIRSSGQTKQQHLAPGVSAATEGAHRLRRLRRARLRTGPAARARSGARRRRSVDDDARAGVEQERRDRRGAARLLPLGVLDQPQRRLRVARAAAANAWFVQGHAGRGSSWRPSARFRWRSTTC